MTIVPRGTLTAKYFQSTERKVGCLCRVDAPSFHSYMKMFHVEHSRLNHPKTLWEKRTSQVDLSTWLNWVHMTIVPRGTLTPKSSKNAVGKMNLSGRHKYLAE